MGTLSAWTVFCYSSCFNRFFSMQLSLSGMVLSYIILCKSQAPGKPFFWEIPFLSGWQSGFLCLFSQRKVQKKNATLHTSWHSPSASFCLKTASDWCFKHLDFRYFSSRGLLVPAHGLTLLLLQYWLRPEHCVHHTILRYLLR